MSTASIGNGTTVLAGVVIALSLLFGALRLGVLPPLVGFGASMVIWIGGTVTGLVLGLLALRSADSRPEAWPVILLALALLAPIAWLLPGLRKPPIHDITTSLEDPPAFVAALEAPANRGRDLSYPHGGEDVPARQREAYPEIEPVRVDMPPVEALQRSLAVARELGWQVVEVDAVERRIEATATSGLFRFVDDIVVRVRADGEGSRIDLRSTSRVGRSDLGANAARIRAFADKVR